MAFCEVKNLYKSYGTGSQASEVLCGLNLEIQEGEFVAIVGFSGSGKTTLISTIGGLIAADKGEVLLKGEKVTGPHPSRGVVFQSYSLMPWLTVYGNIGLAVDEVFRHWPKAKRKQHIHKYIEMVGLGHAIDRPPTELSGGMRQRVAVARALAMARMPQWAKSSKSTCRDRAPANSFWNTPATTTYGKSYLRFLKSMNTQKKRLLVQMQREMEYKNTKTTARTKKHPLCGMNKTARLKTIRFKHLKLNSSYFNPGGK